MTRQITITDEVLERVLYTMSLVAENYSSIVWGIVSRYSSDSTATIGYGWESELRHLDDMTLATKSSAEEVFTGQLDILRDLKVIDYAGIDEILTEFHSLMGCPAKQDSVNQWLYDLERKMALVINNQEENK